MMERQREVLRINAKWSIQKFSGILEKGNIFEKFRCVTWKISKNVL